MGPGNVDTRTGESPRRSTKIDFTNTTSLTKQAFAKGTRVDSILKKYATQGVNPNDVGLFRANVAQQPFGVADTTLDYQQQLNRIIRIQDYFKKLPSGIREKFAHNPANMLTFMADKRNLQECIKLGLIIKEEPVKTDPKNTDGKPPAGETSPPPSKT